MDIGITLFVLALMIGPGIIAIYFNHRRKYLIAIISFLIGWTVIGAMVMFIIVIKDALKGTKLEKWVEKNEKIIMRIVFPLLVVGGIIGLTMSILDYMKNY